MAQTVHLWIRGESVGEIQGDSTITSMNREGTIEAFQFESSVRIPIEAGSGSAVGERSYSPITITKRIDRSSPVLHQALCTNDPLEVTIRFYRPNPAGDGTTEQFYTIQLRQARISSIKTVSPNTLTDEGPAFEEVSIVFGAINYTYEPAGVEFEDEWRVG